LPDDATAVQPLAGPASIRSPTAAVGRRSILVHEYTRVDLSIVAEAVPVAQRDLAEFVRQVARSLRRRE
jgi:uncharacterized protein YutE (UPF0331/DUF86 family)